MVLMQNGDQIAGGGMPVLYITQAQYDANPSAYNDPNVLVHITDAPSGHLMGKDMAYNANMNFENIGNIATKSLGKVEYKADNVALYAHAVGDYFINKDGEYCRCISAISVGQTLTKNTNYVVTDVGSEIKGIYGSAVSLTGGDRPSELDYCNIQYMVTGNIVIVGGAVHFTARPSANVLYLGYGLPQPADFYNGYVNIPTINSSNDILVSCGIDGFTSTYPLQLFNSIIPLIAGWYRISGQYVKA